MGCCSSDCALAGVKSASGVTNTMRSARAENHEGELELLLAWRVMVRMYWYVPLARRYERGDGSERKTTSSGSSPECVSRKG